MTNTINFKNISAQFICIALLLSILTMEYIMIQSNRGSAMGISFSLYFIPLIVFILPILFALDKNQSNHLSRVVGLVSQGLFFGYFVYKTIFYYRVNNDIQYYKDNFEDHFSPRVFELVFVFMIIALIILYSTSKIVRKRI